MTSDITVSSNIHQITIQWSSNQIDVFSYRYDEHQEKITFRYRFLEICLCMNGRLRRYR